jgi:hypothetical protein
VRLKSDFIKVRLGYTPSLFACKREFVGGGGLLFCEKAADSLLTGFQMYVVVSE